MTAEEREPRALADLSQASWRKSSLSGNGGADCVEVASVPGLVAVRDSKDSGGAVLVFSSGGWTAFLGRLKAGDFGTRP
ncbi:DUF397 domain-containing protein [Streptosporangium sp. NPDC050855]|uniref:DUF397 domain-containing protein n=1 Tax=Streptosporangium sp. NPDC050855 TaxID=3366194 RepID=UPI0037A12895